VPDAARPLAFVDIDGVVADVRHRLHHIEHGRRNWNAFFAAVGDDPAHPEGLAVVHTLAVEHRVVFLTGRPERLRDVTARWLDANGIGGWTLVMRRANDRRPAAQMKLAQIAQLGVDGTVAMIVDDDDRVLAAAQAAGYPTFAAKWEQRSPTESIALAQAQERDGVT
jgi:phosphoglycolate phosphatase-like HAD superfamily hydrolase